MGGKYLTEGEEVGAEGVGEADVVTAEGPAMAHVSVEGREGEGQDAPDEGIIQDADMVGDRHQPSPTSVIV